MVDLANRDWSYYQHTDLTLPAEVAEHLSALHQVGAYPRLKAFIAGLRQAGWTLRACAEPLGITTQAVSRLEITAEWVETEDVPLPPRKPTRMPKVQPRLKLRPEVAEELRRQCQIARTVNGATLADDSRRDVSLELTRTMAFLLDQGISLRELAQAMNISLRAVSARLERHGYRTSPPSQKHAARYTGSAWFEVDR